MRLHIQPASLSAPKPLAGLSRNPDEVRKRDRATEASLSHP